MGSEAAEGLRLLEQRLNSIGYTIDKSRGDYKYIQLCTKLILKRQKNLSATKKFSIPWIMPRTNRNDNELIRSIIEKARLCKGL